MTDTVEISNQAETDLRGIYEYYEYIAFHLLSVENALGQLNRLENRIMELAQLPERFRKYNREPWSSRGMRCMPVDNYLVFYIPDKATYLVTIIRVIYAGRDIDKQLTRCTSQPN